MGENTLALIFPSVVIWGAPHEIAPLHQKGMPLYELSDLLAARVLTAQGDPGKVRALITYEATVYDGFEIEGPAHD